MCGRISAKCYLSQDLEVWYKQTGYRTEPSWQIMVTGVANTVIARHCCFMFSHCLTCWMSGEEDNLEEYSSDNIFVLGKLLISCKHISRWYIRADVFPNSVGLTTSHVMNRSNRKNAALLRMSIVMRIFSHHGDDICGRISSMQYTDTSHAQLIFIFYGKQLTQNGIDYAHI